MRHLEVLFIPVLSLLDYGLTLAGAKLAEREYRKHFKIQHYEMNPLWQKSVAERRWWNPRYLLLLAAITLLLVLVTQGLPELALHILLGALFVIYGSVLGQHLGNLLLFRHLARSPGEVDGEVRLSHPLVLYMARVQRWATLLPLAMVALLTRNAYALGGVLGILLLMLVQVLWGVRARRARRVDPAPAAAAPEGPQQLP